MAEGGAPDAAADPAADLWGFALALYAFPGVADACLCLQEDGADVNLLIFALWQAAGGIELPADRFVEVEAATREWREDVVRKLRDLGRHVAPAGELGQTVRSAQLEAERQQLLGLAAFAATASKSASAPLAPAVAARSNLVAYQAAVQLELPESPLEDLMAAFLRALATGFAS